MTEPSVPSLYEWIGGIEALNRLTTRFYEHVKTDALLAPIFANMGAEHPAHVAAFIGEVFGGPATYSTHHGGHPHMIKQHLSRHLTQEQRRHWVALLLNAADELGIPDDPEFRSTIPRPVIGPYSSFRDVDFHRNNRNFQNRVFLQPQRWS